MRKFLVFFFSFLSLSTYADEYMNRFSIGNFKSSTLQGFYIEYEYLRLLAPKHVAMIRLGKWSKTSQTTISPVYRYYFQENAMIDSWYTQLKTSFTRNDNYTDHSKSDYKSASVAGGHQWVFKNDYSFTWDIGLERSSINRSFLVVELFIGYNF